MIKIAVPNYTNSIPFTEGLKPISADNYKLQLYYPSKITQHFSNKKIDLALLPSIYFYKKRKDISILDNYCIGATNQVASVCLVSNDPIHKLDTIFLYYQSNTSNILLQILLKELWKINPKITFAENNNIFKNLKPRQAALVIGDKAFEVKQHLNYCYDLSEAWYELTELPFVFALWGYYKHKINEGQKEELTTCFKDGIEQCRKKTFPKNEFFDVHNYLNQNISYSFDHPKKKALELFLFKYNKHAKDCISNFTNIHSV